MTFANSLDPDQAQRSEHGALFRSKLLDPLVVSLKYFLSWSYKNLQMAKKEPWKITQEAKS